jgi:hypothetical protein
MKTQINRIDTNLPDIFCGNCTQLNLTEREQTLLYDITDKKVNHFCRKLGKQVKHLGVHPNLPRLKKCLKNNYKTLK